MALDIAELYEIFNHVITADPATAGVTTDSRKVAPGSIFFALRGDNFDGNAYAATALEQGAAAAVVEAGRWSESLPTDDPRYFVCDDPLLALQHLASHHRRVLNPTIVSLTGSNGKTTTKELILRVLSTKFRVCATQGNLNNHIGVPLTLLAMRRHHDIGIVEMGANHRGEIALLCDIATPDIGLITNIGRAHLEGFGGVDGVRQGKGEMFDYLAKHQGVAIYPDDDPTLSSMVSERHDLHGQSYSLTDLGLEIERPAPDSQHLTVRSAGRSYATAMVGDYNIRNIAAAVAVGRHFGISTDQALEAASSYSPDNNRSQVIVTQHNTLYMDAYNANPSSMHAALTNFGNLNVENKVVILGDMLELGEYSQAEHAAILQLAISLEYEVILAGKLFSDAVRASAFGPESLSAVSCFSDVARLDSHLSDHRLTGKHILIKGSRGISLEKITHLL